MMEPRATDENADPYSHYSGTKMNDRAAYTMNDSSFGNHPTNEVMTGSIESLEQEKSSSSYDEQNDHKSHQKK